MEMAYRILNKQLADSNTQLKESNALSEFRLNEMSSVVLQTRNENGMLRSMVRNLRYQLQMITQVVLKVNVQADTLFSTINQDQEQDHGQLRQPLAPAVYERKRAERVAFVEKGAIQEDESVPEEHENEASNHSSNPVIRSGGYDEAAVQEDKHLIDEAVEGREEEEDEEEEEEDDEEGEEGDDEDSEPNVIMELPAHLVAKSPLVQRTRPKSRRNSFNEPFENIDRDRALQLGRRSQSQRDSHLGISLNHNNNNSNKNGDETDLEPPMITQTQKRSDSEMNIDESILDTLRNISMAQNEVNHFLNSMHSEQHTNLSVTDTTVFNPDDMLANASCSTAVAKGAAMAAKTKGVRKLFEIKTKSATDLHKNNSTAVSMQPVVVLQPQTEDELKEFYDSGRPRRKAAPANMREPSLTSKLRRE